MSRDTGSSCKKCRRIDTKLFLKGTKCYTKCIMERRANQRANQKGGKFRSKKSEYAIHLIEKQKARMMAGMTEQPFANLFHKAAQTTGQTGETFLQFLEMRLDNIVRRIGFAVSLKTARQIVKHGHIKVNDVVVDIPSYQVRVGDVVSLISMKETPAVKQGLEETDKRSLRPSFLEYDAQNMSGKLLRLPDHGELSFPVKEQLIVEFYSK